MKPAFAAALSVVLLPFTLSVPAQESAAQRHAQATNLVKHLAADITARCLTDIHTLEQWRMARTELRRQLLYMLGLDPLPPRTPLRAAITGRLERPAYRIEKVVFQSSPGLYVTGNFYLPNHSAGPLPTILYLCGHAPHPLGAKFNYQDRASWFAAHGYACLILDTLEFGEVAGIHHGTHDLNMWNWLSLGYTPAGTEVWNAIRALDYLETRPEVDPRRIGLTGISGGGAMTWYTAAVDDRIAAAAPVCSTITYGSQAAHWVAQGQCDCIYYYNTFQWDFPIVAALIAPRPLLILSGQKDGDFPPDGYHEVFQRAKRIYDLEAGGNSDRIRELDANVGHSDPPLFLREARQWMQRWLKSDSTPLPDETTSLPKETAEDLACLKDWPADAANFKIQNELTQPVVLKRPTSKFSWDKRRAEVLVQLKDKVFRWFPTNTIPFDAKTLKTNGAWMNRYAEYRDVSFQTEEGVRIRAQLLPAKANSSGAPVLIYPKRSLDSISFVDVDELLPLMGRCTILMLNPRLTETPMSATEYTAIERTAVWSGRTIAAMQVWDILRAVRWVLEEEKLGPGAVSIYGKGDMGILALYAGLFDPRIQRVILNDPPGSHWQSPALLNVLRITDVPEVAGAFAPRRLTCVTPWPVAFTHARSIYRLARASREFVQSSSLPEALQP